MTKMALIKGEMCFSPNYKFKYLDPKNFESILNAFRDRIEGWYLNILKHLLEDSQNDFIVVAIECMLIDTLAGYRYGCKTNHIIYPKFLKEFLNMTEEEAVGFYKRFRCGILHETRIKENSYISREIDDLLLMKNNEMFLNPEILYGKLKNYFDEYMQDLTDNEKTEQINNFKKHFKELFHEEKDIDLSSWN
ncbi:MAG: hypothetical protein B5M53_06610 [Candidatus Cloacimonas sp. 4484_209]|nr:MAG: hypothetical protein B5M53_06610 [Candidatus Cloacimonas sp. 4484_209]